MEQAFSGSTWRACGSKTSYGCGVVLALRLATPGERSHLVEYAIVATLVHEALEERAAQGGSVPLPAVLAFSVAAAIGALDEGLRYWSQTGYST